MNNSIAYKHLGIATAILVTGQLCLGFWQSHWHYSHQLKGLKQRVHNKANFLSAVSAESILELDLLGLKNLMEQISEDADLVYSVIIDSEGKALTSFFDEQHPIIAQTINNNFLDKNTLDIIDLVNQDSTIYQINKTISHGEKLLGEIWLGYSHRNIKLKFYRVAILNFASAIVASILLASLTFIFLKKPTKLDPGIVDRELDERDNTSPENNETDLLEEFFHQMAIQLKEAVEGLHKNNEELVLTNAKLARATRLKDEFLASMSHELRTPLNAILGLSEALLEEVYGTLTEKQSRSLTTIHSSGKHLLALINDILDLAKIESGKEKLNISVTELSPLCNASLDLITEQATKKNIHLDAQIEVGLGCIELDERRIKQVLINLLNNAVKFTPSGGKVTLKVWGDSQEEEIIFSVVDTGIGIKPENMDKLFESFVQIESSLSRRYEGTGLGLALVKKIIELHGGSISVKSEVDKGSQFTFILPWKKMTNSHSESNFPIAHPQLTVNHSQSLILLVEDNEANVLTISDYLISQGYKLIFAHNGFEAIKMAKEKKPSLILMDIQMPLMDGLEATRRIRQERETANIPIIALTALTMPGDRDKCLTAGVNEYMTKPINLKQLIGNIEKQLATNLNNNLINKEINIDSFSSWKSAN